MGHHGARIEIHGTVQGVGFRPFVYRLATEMGLDGWVRNDANGVFMEIDGPEADLHRFVARMEAELPAVAAIDDIDVEMGMPAGHAGFHIRHSSGGSEPTAVILPDLATCADCMRDVTDPGDRRHRYPFTNCTNCGPRFSIIRELPYDRPGTAMAEFAMCATCRAEYDDPLDRRFHAQPTACPACGPHLTWRGHGTATDDEGIIALAADAIRSGSIVALKGIGGYQLLVDAENTSAVDRLRERKQRPTKPLALMVRDLDVAASVVHLSDSERSVLGSIHAPIVLARRRDDGLISPSVAPGNDTLGVMLPTTPLHHLVCRRVGRPMVATSGNRTDEPIAIDDGEAIERLAHIADAFVTHDRPVERHMDDSVVRRIAGEIRILRRARGYAPLPIALRDPAPSILAVGAHLKSTVAVTSGRNVFVSQHIGDLETIEADRAFGRVIDDLTRMYDVRPEIVAHDLHPAYRSTARAGAADLFPEARRVAVQHHHAHLASCLADNDHPGPALGVTWDGTGYGTDGTVWGGEFLLGDATGFERVGHLRPFTLPGGDAAVRDPRRSAIAVLHASGARLDADVPAAAGFSAGDVRLLTTMIERGINTPVTTSAGRIFDAVAAIVGVRTHATFEGEAAIALEHAAVPCDDGYPLPIESTDGAHVLDWRPTILAVADDIASGAAPSVCAGRFHRTLAEAIGRMASIVGHDVVALTGGCFQNRLLTEQTAGVLEGRGFTVLVHRRVPPNDGGISLGQAAIAAARHRGTALVGA